MRIFSRFGLISHKNRLASNLKIQIQLNYVNFRKKDNEIM